MEVRKKLNLNLETLDPEAQETGMITDHSLRASGSVSQGWGCTMSLVGVGELTLWLRISSLTDKGKVEPLDARAIPILSLFIFEPIDFPVGS